MQINVEGKNKKYSDILKENYISKFSDLSSFLLYNYEDNLYNKTDTYFSDNMNKLSIDSLNHYKIIGKLIALLGGNPNYDKFMIEDNFYKLKKEELIEVDIRLIKEKIILYTKSLNMIDDKYIKEILTNFIVEERKNLKIVELLQLKYKKNKFK